MQLHVKGKNLEVSDSIRRYAERKLAKLDRKVHELTRVEVELAVERNPSVAENQVAEATVWLKGHTLRARESSRDMKASIDELTEKLLRQIKDEHGKRTARRRAPGGERLTGDSPPALPPEVALFRRREPLHERLAREGGLVARPSFDP